MTAATMAAIFILGYQCSDQHSGIAITNIVGVHGSPRCKADGTCPWRIEWTSKKEGLRAEFLVETETGNAAAFVPATGHDHLKFPVFKDVNLPDVRGITVRVRGPHGVVIAEAEFR